MPDKLFRSVLPGEPRELPKIDTSVAHIARVYDYWLGGKDNFAIDREVGQKALQAHPETVLSVQANRRFLARSVRHLAAEEGVRQFLDVGTGLPSANNTHEVAQAVAPESRVFYVDNDPIVLAHARALLTSSPQGETAYLDADIKDTDEILAGAAQVLDLSQPVGVMLVAVLHMLRDEDDPQAVVDRLMAAVPSGSYLVMAHAASDIAPEASAEMARRYNEMSSASITPRSREQVERFFGGLDLVPPGLVPISKWGLAGQIDTTVGGLVGYCAIARKP